MSLAFPYKCAHFVGLGGVGMSATAMLLRDAGVVVSGSDEAVYPPVSDVLREQKLVCRTPYAATNIPARADLIVIGKNARLTPDQNAEVAEAFARAQKPGGPAILSFAEALGLLSRGSEAIVAAGSFGKTTSVSLLAHCLETCGLDPAFMIGAAPLSPAVPARLGRGGQFLLEGDEYPSSNTDDRSKFLHYEPTHLLLTPLAHDHVNVFPTIDSYLAPFETLVARVPEEGLVVASVSGPLSRRFLDSVTRPVITFGIEGADWSARDIVLGERTRFTLARQGARVVEVETGQLGLHNIENMVGVGALLLTRGLVNAEDFARAMGSFRGIRRRLDRKSDRTSAAIFEGFGSSYDKARSAIAAMRQHFPKRRLICVFEPHTFSWRNRKTLHWYDDAFEGCAETLIFTPAEQGAGTHDQASQDEIVARVRAGGFAATPIASKAEGEAALRALLRPDDAVLLLTSGDLGGLIEAAVAIAEERFPA